MAENIGWPLRQSPFHKAELELQARFGLVERIDPRIRKVMSDFIPADRRSALHAMPFIVTGTTDPQGRIWASMLDGAPGFLSTPDKRTLRVARSTPLHEPLAGSISVGRPMGLVSVDLTTRRRFRMNGRIVEVDDGGFAVRVDQTFPNCPQFIQTRQMNPADAEAARKPFEERLQALSPRECTLIEHADSMFIASGIAGKQDDPSIGNDVSYRGGNPGFVRIDDERTLTIPDFVGNFLFNTIGNLIVNPSAGLLFVDFGRGDLLHLTGKVEIVWEAPEIKAFVGAQRLLRFTLTDGIYCSAALNHRWTFQEFSPDIANTGDWKSVEQTLMAESVRDAKRRFRVTRIVDEAKDARSFYLAPDDEVGLPLFQAGQFLPLELPSGGNDKPLSRMYSLSGRPNGRDLRVTVKRVRDPATGRQGTGSNWLHDNLAVGDTIFAAAPRGRFTPDYSANRPLALISAGIGITPMVAILHEVFGTRADRTRHMNRVHFITGARNGREHAFREEVMAIADLHAPGRKLVRYAELTTHVRYSQPTSDDRIGIDYHSVGHVDHGLVASELPPDDYDYFVCGPDAMIAPLCAGLLASGVAVERIHTELFGRAPARGVSVGNSDAFGPESGRSITVTFARSGRTADWRRDQGTLLELAENSGISPGYGCRTGACGVCATGLVSGRVRYLTTPAIDVARGEVLLCCSVPDDRSPDSQDDQEFVLDL